ncbi:MAG: peptide chain release factor N(5)-glutamine methyltransferase [Deltaproteobacteria bacterium]|nr:peptide chain release factor N(5)-glutamine methyltransferase [Deltaproteobacteria bacterium]
MDQTPLLTVFELLKWTEDSLKLAEVEEWQREALLMVASALSLRPADVKAYGSRPVHPGCKAIIGEWVRRRKYKEPLQYIIGETEFMGRDFMVGPGVLIPRPETEILVGEALAMLKAKGVSSSPFVLDICSGSGCIAVSVAVEFPDVKVIATDISPDAVETTVKNALLNGVYENIECLEGDLFEPLREQNLEGRFDLILANPPYVASNVISTLEEEVKDFEPRLALDGGTDGLDVIRRLVQGAATYLKPGCALIMEVGYDQVRGVEGIIRESGAYDNIVVKKDYSGIERVVMAFKKMG